MQQHVSLARGGAGQRSLAWLTRRFGRRPSDLLFRGVTLLLVFIVLALVAGVALVLLINSWSTIQQFGFSFLTNLAFDPVHNVFGVLPAIFGTLVTSAFAMLFAIPIGVSVAIFLVDFCPRALRQPLAFFADLLAAVPSEIGRAHV